MLPIHELLDRFEILFPLNSRIRDLRRSYIDKDLSSIFRLVTDKNKEDLRKFIMQDNIWKLWPLLDDSVNTQFVSAFKNFFVNKTNIDADCFSRGQLQSKIWLIKELEKLGLDLGTVYLCAGWYATLAVMLFESNIKIEKVRSFDIDADVSKIAEIFNKPWVADDWRFKALTKNIMDIDYDQYSWQAWSNINNRMSRIITDSPKTIINTSCEHIENFTDWYNKIPNGKLLVLQTNNFFEVEEHVNCSVDLEEFSSKAPMTTVLYEGELELLKYKRFMKIGYR